MYAKKLLALLIGSLLLLTGLRFPVQAEDAAPVYLPFVTGAVPSPAIDVREEILIPAGNFQMGCDSENPAEFQCAFDHPQTDELPLHTVYLDAYYIDKYEVTNGRYKACVDAGICTAPQQSSSSTRPSYYNNEAYAEYPVIKVTWHQANAFCSWEGKRLLSEAEWEKAARGSDDTRRYPWGNADALCSLTNTSFYPQDQGGCVNDTAKVGSYPDGASPYGVMDMAGNVYEWINDWYDGLYYTTSPDSNPQGPATGTAHVIRGGGWSYCGENCEVRIAGRISGYLPSEWTNSMGFRCARTPGG